MLTVPGCVAGALAGKWNDQRFRQELISLSMRVEKASEVPTLSLIRLVRCGRLNEMRTSFRAMEVPADLRDLATVNAFQYATCTHGEPTACSEIV